MTEQERIEMTETITASVKSAILEANADKAAADKKAQIMAIRDTIERQRAIAENMDLFKG